MRGRGWFVAACAIVLACNGGGSAPDAGDTGDVAEGIDVEEETDGAEPDAEADAEEASEGTDGPDGETTLVGGAPPGSACVCDSDCAGDLAHPGFCVTGICMLRALRDCADAGSAGECPAGLRCWAASGREGAICYPDCASFSCVGTCDEDGSCAPSAGTDTCDPACATYCGRGTSPIGGPCVSDADCAGDAICYPEWYGREPTGFVGGYCLEFSCSSTSCPDGSVCIRVNPDGTRACMRSCASDADCRGGYYCEESSSTCWPACHEGECPSGLACWGEPGDDFCAGGGAICSPANPWGWCPEDFWCDEGICSDEPFACEPDAREPNESIDEAGAIPEADGGLTICADDEDWFRFTVAEARLATVRIGFHNALSDLDLVGYDVDRGILGARGEGGYPYHSSYRDYETDEEALSFLNAAGDDTDFAVRILGYRSAVGPYALSFAEDSWVDGDSCTGEGFEDCDGREDGALALVEFPFPDPDDGYVGDRYAFDTASNYRWARREAIMAVRWALHMVNERYPFDDPLGVIDICQSDGITPGYDIGEPRHPETTHDQGGNIDVAYFQTGPDNRARIICGDGSTHEDGYCSSAAATQHTVDLPRHAYFMAMLAQWGSGTRLRVTGIDRVIGPLVEDELARLADEGVLTAAQRDRTLSRMAYGDGWPYHHHHIHISFQWWRGKSAVPPEDREMAMPGAPPVRFVPLSRGDLRRPGCLPLGCER